MVTSYNNKYFFKKGNYCYLHFSIHSSGLITNYRFVLPKSTLQKNKKLVNQQVVLQPFKP